jgi:hypothetical protein
MHFCPLCNTIDNVQYEQISVGIFFYMSHKDCLNYLTSIAHLFFSTPCFFATARISEFMDTVYGYFLASVKVLSKNKFLSPLKNRCAAQIISWWYVHRKEVEFVFLHLFCNIGMVISIKRVFFLL